MTETITVRPDTGGTGGDRYMIHTRGHQIPVDQPIEDGGADTAPTPTELFVAGLVSCVAFYAGRYLTRHGIDRTGLSVTAGWTMATGRPARVGRVDITITPPAALPGDRIPALLAVASHCTVHNSLGMPPEVSISMTPDGPRERDVALTRVGEPAAGGPATPDTSMAFAGPDPAARHGGPGPVTRSGGPGAVAGNGATGPGGAGR